ncbi:MAG: phosphoribosyl-ATP diphosphatase [Actinobacteria bacterium]|mgnify:CR=1 FL=1|nr:phosphoribosyl-ATP diphosphatase [Actinomycetota bacterium]MCB9388712.1 phosphoribosyl-ATP diphosphatase [Acidimicrobiia bacterium]
MELNALEAVVIERSGADPDASYTARLLADSVLIRRKIMEEAFEVTLELEAAEPDKARVAEEAADLLYHLTVGLVSAGVSIGDVLDELAARRR